MPPVIVGAALSAALATGAAWAAGTLIPLTLFGSQLLANFAVHFATGVILGGISHAMQRKPKLPDAIGFNQDRTVSVRQPVAPWQVVVGRARVGGTIAFLTTTNNNKDLHIIYIWAAHEIDAYEKLWFDEEEIPLDGAGNATGRFAGKVVCKHHFGAPDQLADADLVAAAPAGMWTADHRLRNLAYSYLKLVFDDTLFPNGVPNVTVQMRGAKFFDPRSGLTAWTQNPSIIKAGYLCDTRFGYGCVYATEIDEPSLVAAANVDDELVTLDAGGTEKRYTCNGSFSCDEEPGDIITALNTSNAGRTLIGPRMKFRSGAYTAPTVTLDKSHLRGGIKGQGLVAREEAFNTVKGVFYAPANQYQPADFPAVTSATYKAHDSNEEIATDIDLRFTDSSTMAQRLAKIHLERARREASLTLPCDLSAIELEALDNVGFTYERFGWTNKPFEIQRFTITQDRQEGNQGGNDGPPLIGCDLSLRSIDANVFAWSATEEGDFGGAPGTDFPSTAVGAPTNLQLNSGSSALVRLGDGTVISRIRVDWTSTPAANLEAHEVEYKKSADADWIAAGAVPRGQSFLYVAPVEDAVNYDVRVRARSIQGTFSTYSSVTNHTVVGKTAAPPAPTGVSANGSVKGILLRWTKAPDADLAVTEVWENTVNNSATATKLAEPDTDFFDRVGLNKGDTRFYWLKSRDTNGNVSGFSAGVTATAQFINVGDLSSAGGTSGSAARANGGWHTEGNVAVSTSGQPVQCIGGISCIINTQLQCRILRDGGALVQFSPNNEAVPIGVRDPVGAGTFTYTLQSFLTVGNNQTINHYFYVVEIKG